METTEDSTTATDQYTEEDRQSIVDRYTTVMLQAILEDPWYSIPEITEILADIGPLHTPTQIFDIFWGRSVYLRTLTRMNVVRMEAIRGRIGSLPITTELPEEGEGEVGNTIPYNDGYIHWWAPRVGEDGPLFPVGMIRAEGGMLTRYPHDGAQTEEYLSEQAEEGTSDTGTKHNKDKKYI